MVQACLGQLERQIAVAARLALVDKACAWAVHRLDRIVLVIDERRVHVVLVVVPVATRLPERAGQDLGRLHLVVVVTGHHLMPVVDERVFELGAVGQPERETRAFFGEHEQFHLGANLAMVAFGGFCLDALVFGKLVLRGKRDAVDAREHLVVLVALPVSSRGCGELECLERLGVEDVRADAHVDVLALLVERDARVVSQIADVLDLVVLVAFLHKRDGLFARQLERRELQVLLGDLAHLGLDRREIFFRNLRVAQVDIVIKAVVGRRTVTEIGLWVEPLYGLGHDVRCRMAQYVELFALRAFAYMTVVVKNLHGNLFGSNDICLEILPLFARPKVQTPRRHSTNSYRSQCQPNCSPRRRRNLSAFQRFCLHNQTRRQTHCLV